MKLDRFPSRNSDEATTPEIDVQLTKRAHRNPDLHQIGDSLPESLLSYIDGTATLNSDTAGNTPVLLRSSQEASISASLGVAGSYAVVPGISISVTCPPQATGSPFIRVLFNMLVGISSGGGATVNDMDSRLFVNGIGFAKGRIYVGVTPYLRQFWLHFSKSIKVPISPGQTLTLDWRAITGAVSPAAQTVYAINGDPLDCNMIAELYY